LLFIYDYYYNYPTDANAMQLGLLYSFVVFVKYPPPQKRGNRFGWSNVHMLCMAKHATCIDTALRPAKGESI
jgi:hypothetical protein